jgi:demethylmenaquinone methyltransferase/2-methoxy-6-polyprenyl-1,4-benzoquinol methylase
MPEGYYDSGERRAEKVNRLFARIARRYDLLNDIQSFGLHRFWKRRVVEMARPVPGVRALDVCCGTGDLAFALARSGVETIGIDFTSEMIERARVRLRRDAGGAGGNPTFELGDAQSLRFPDNTFDIVTVGYGLRNLASWQAGLNEMCRVARPGGRLVVLDFGKPTNPIWRSLYFGYLRCLVPVLGWLFCGDARAYSYILESLQHYPAQEGVAAHMANLGLEKVRIQNFLGGAMSINSGEKPAQPPPQFPL